MLINKQLQKLNYIFINNVNIDYIKALVDLDSFPIFMMCKNHTRIPTAVVPTLNYIHKDYNLFHEYSRMTFLEDLPLFNLEPCNITDIKEILYKIKISGFTNIFYFITIKNANK